MPALIYFHARDNTLRVQQDAEDAVSLFEASPERPVRLTTEGGAAVFVNWRNVEYVEDEPALE